MQHTDDLQYWLFHFNSDFLLNGLIASGEKRFAVRDHPLFYTVHVESMQTL